MGEKSYN